MGWKTKGRDIIWLNSLPLKPISLHLKGPSALKAGKTKVSCLLKEVEARLLWEEIWLQRRCKCQQRSHKNASQVLCKEILVLSKIDKY